MSGTNIVRNLQVLYFSKKNKKIKSLKNDEKFVAQYRQLYMLLLFCAIARIFFSMLNNVNIISLFD